MASLNRVTIMGNLGQDPELRYTPSQVPVATLSVATTENWKDHNGERKSETQWHRVVVWNKAAENCHKFLRKGSSILVEGKVVYKSYQDKNGNRVYSTQIAGKSVHFLGGGKSQHQDQTAPSQPTVQQQEFDDIPF